LNNTSTVGFGSTLERRRAPRYQLFADVEIVECRSRLRFHARTTDVSLFGCYIDSVNWLPAGSEIELQIMHKDATVTADGRVVRSGPAKGVGVEFTVVGSDAKAILKDWIADARRG
jgi:hypothetical protein